MLSLKDCLDFCDLEECAVEALAEHQGIPLIIAIQLGNGLVNTPEGLIRLHYMMMKQLESALEQGNAEKLQLATQSCQSLHDSNPMPIPIGAESWDAESWAAMELKQIA